MPAVRDRSLAWAGYAAFGWAAAYAIGVRGYQGLGGTVGISGTFEDPAGMRRASLIAGAGILLVGIGALATVRPWGLRLPRWLVIVPALTGSAYAAAHALTAYVTKPLDAVGVVELQFRGWERRDQTICVVCEPLVEEAGAVRVVDAYESVRATGLTQTVRRVA